MLGATERVSITLTQAAAARELSADKTSIPVNAGDTSVTFNVTANVPWEITNSDTWITTIAPDTGSDNQQITITYEVNTAITEREATLTLAATGVGATESVPITLTQAKAARELSADKTSINASPPMTQVSTSTSQPMSLGKSPKETRMIGFSTFCPKREALMKWEALMKLLPSYTKKIPRLQTRDAVLTLAATDAGTESVTITLTQDAVARALVPSQTSISVDADDTSVTFDVTANVPWEITKIDTDDLDYHHCARQWHG